MDISAFLLTRCFLSLGIYSIIKPSQSNEDDSFEIRPNVRLFIHQLFKFFNRTRFRS